MSPSLFTCACLYLCFHTPGFFWRLVWIETTPERQNRVITWAWSFDVNVKMNQKATQHLQRYIITYLTSHCSQDFDTFISKVVFLAPSSIIYVPPKAWCLTYWSFLIFLAITVLDYTKRHIHLLVWGAVLLLLETVVMNYWILFTDINVANLRPYHPLLDAISRLYVCKCINQCCPHTLRVSEHGLCAPLSEWVCAFFAGSH